MAAELSIWISWLGGAAVASILVAAVWWALFADRSRGRRRCPRCWHDRTGAPGLRCAECGHLARSEVQLYATRRRWGLALVAFSVLIAATVAFRARVTREGLAPLTPSRVLLMLLPYSAATPGPPDDVKRELLARMEGVSPESALLEPLARRVVAGDRSAPPGSIAWQHRYGRFANEFLALAEVSNDQTGRLKAIVESFRDLPPRPVVVAARSAGPEGPLLVDFAVVEWWPDSVRAEIVVTDLSDGRSHRLALDAGATSRVLPLEFAGPRPEESSRTFAVSIRPAGDERSFEASLPIDLTSLVSAPALKPYDDAAASAAVGEVFREGVLRWQSGGHPVAFRIDAGRTIGEEFAGVLFGVETSLFEGDALLRTIRVWWPGGPQGGGVRSEVLFEDLPALAELDAERPERYALRIRGISSIAARAYVPSADAESIARPSADRYWAGEVTLPAAIAPRIGEAPRRRWQRLPSAEAPPGASTAPVRP